MKRFSETLVNPTPRFNDVVKPEGEVIIEPGAGVSSLIWRCQGLGNLENDEGKKFHTFVEHGRNSMKKFQNVFEKVRDRG